MHVSCHVMHVLCHVMHVSGAGDPGAYAFTRALRHNTTLIHLNLSHNNVSPPMMHTLQVSFLLPLVLLFFAPLIFLETSGLAPLSLPLLLSLALSWSLLLSLGLSWPPLRSDDSCCSFLRALGLLRYLACSPYRYLACSPSPCPRCIPSHVLSLVLTPTLPLALERVQVHVVFHYMLSLVHVVFGTCCL